METRKIGVCWPGACNVAVFHPWSIDCVGEEILWGLFAGRLSLAIVKGLCHASVWCGGSL